MHQTIEKWVYIFHLLGNILTNSFQFKILNYFRSTILDEWTQEQIDKMIVGGNAKAKAFFKSHGISDNLKGEAKYNNKTAELYRQKITEMALEYRESGNKNSTTTHSSTSQTVQSSSDNKGSISLKELENSLPLEVSINPDKKAVQRKRFFDDFDDSEEDIQEPSKIMEENKSMEVNNNLSKIEDQDEDMEEPMDERRTTKTSKFMYSDSFDIDEPVKEKNKQNKVIKNDLNEQDYEYTGHSLFDDRPQRKKVISSNTDKFVNKDPKLQSFKEAKSISSRQYFGEDYLHNRSDEESRNRLAKFSNAKSISYYDYHGYPKQEESDDFDEIVSRIARTAKEDIKDLGRTLKKTGERLAEWLNELTED